MKKWKILAVAVIIVILLIVIVRWNANLSYLSIEPPPMDAVYENEDYGFSINYPEGYKTEPLKGWQDPTEVFRARSPAGTPLLAIRILYMEDNTPYEEVLDIYKDVIRIQAYTNVIAGPKKDIVLPDGTTAWQTEISYKVAGYELKTLHMWVQKYDRVFMAEATTTRNSWYKNLVEMQAILDSFTAPKHNVPNATKYFSFSGDVPMSDGRTLPAYVVLPEETGQYPIILWYTGYGARAFKLTLMMGGDDDMLFGPDARANYGFVFISMRGRYESGGAWYQGAPTRGEDGADILKWIDEQSWSSNVGIWGWGVDGSVVYDTAAENPEGLTAIAPQFSPWLTEDYTRFYPGGVLREANAVFGADQWGQKQWDVVIAHPQWDSYWDERFADRPKPEDINAYVSLDNGWYGHNVNHIFATYEELKANGPFGNKTKIIIGPWAHMYPGILKQGDLEYPKASKEDRAFHRRFFDYWLAGIDNGLYDEPSIYYYQRGEDEWKFANEWPPKGVSETNYYLHTNGQLLSTMPEETEGSNQYIFDPNDPSPGIGGPYLWPTNDFPDQIIGPAYQDNEVLAGRDDYIIYETPPLTEDLEIAGRPTIKLYVQGNTPDTDIIVRLADYDPQAAKGKKTLLVGIAPQRMRYREGLKKTVWMEPGEIYEIDIKMDNVAYTWKKGHKIRIIVSSSAYPLYAINPNNKDHFMWDAGEPLVSEVRLWSNGDYPSRLILPVMAS
jgi:predicted acyl esterase